MAIDRHPRLNSQGSLFDNMQSIILFSFHNNYIIPGSKFQNWQFPQCLCQQKFKLVSLSSINTLRLWYRYLLLVEHLLSASDSLSRPDQHAMHTVAVLVEVCLKMMIARRNRGISNHRVFPITPSLPLLWK